MPSGRVAQTSWGRDSDSERNRRSLRRRAAIRETIRISIAEELPSNSPIVSGWSGRCKDGTTTMDAGQREGGGGQARPGSSEQRTHQDGQEERPEDEWADPSSQGQVEEQGHADGRSGEGVPFQC
jgi:hypothetical protein